MSTRTKITDISKHPGRQLAHIDPQELLPLPPPYDKIDEEPKWKEIRPEQKEAVESSLDDTIAVGFPKPKTKEEEDELVEKFLSGLHKLLTKEDNWTFLQPLLLSLEHCAKCQTCNDACPIYTASGKQDIYRPTYRSEVWRRIVAKYIKPGGKFFGRFYQ